MNSISKSAVILSSVLLLLGHASAADEPAEPKSANSPGVVTKVEKAIVKGAKAAASGVERGVKAAGRGVERGAKATERVAKRVAAKVSGPASSPASGFDKPRNANP